MLISKIKDLYHLIELTSSSTHAPDKEESGGVWSRGGGFSFKAFFKVSEWEWGGWLGVGGLWGTQ